MLNRQKAADGRVAATFEEASARERAAPEYWKARYGAYGVYPFRKGDSDDNMAFGVKTQAPRLGQEYFKAKYGPTGYAMFNLNEAADTEAGKQVRLPKRQWHAEGIVRPTEYEQ